MAGSDGEALDALCRSQFPRLVGLLALRVGDQRVAEELAQDALVRLCQRWPDIEQPEAWLTRVALNVGNSWLRRRYAEWRAYRRHGASPADTSPPATEETLTIRAAVSALPSRQRTAVILRFYEQLSVAETAEVMGCPQGTVKSLTHRALKRLGHDPSLADEEVTDHA